MRSITWYGAVVAAALSIGAVHAQDTQSFPKKPVRLIVPVPPGGGVDALARMLAEGL